MFLRFAISNHLSIHQSQELSFVASSLKDRDDGLIACDAAPSGSVVPAIMLYGANASGKTNVVSAIQFIVAAVLHSHTKGDLKGGIPRRHFELDPQAASETTNCEVDFVLNGMRHHYGFTATSKRSSRNGSTTSRARTEEGFLSEKAVSSFSDGILAVGTLSFPN